MAAAGNPNITDQLLKGVQLGERTYKNHLDGYNQMDLLNGKGPSKRQELFYFGGGSHRELQVHVLCAALRLAGRKDHPSMVNIRQDPFERTPSIRGESPNIGAFGYGNDFFAREFWRFVMVQQYVGKLALTAVDYPPMQDPASFNLDAVKKKVEEMIKNRPGQ
jgi:arylsulfatase